MANKMIYVDEKKWKEFRLWCVKKGMTIRDRIDLFLNGEYKK